MKIGGVDPRTLPNEETLVLPRGDGFVVFRARGLPDLEEFEKICPEPKAPVKLTKDGLVPDADDKGYKDVTAEYAKRRLAYLVVKSLEPTQIEWDSVKEDQPGTWQFWDSDLKANGFTQVECNLVLGLVMGANALDESKLKKARESFLVGLQTAKAA